MLSILAALPFPEISPSLFTIPRIELGGFGIGPLPLRWYSLSYIIGLVICLTYATALANRPRLYGGVSPVSKDDLDELFLWSVIGMILGGRAGYVLFYLLPFAGDAVAQDPWSLIRIWDGGLSFHGGLIGVSLAMIGVAHVRKISLFSLTDTVSIVVPSTIFLVRIGNFINAELYGRPTNSWMGMIFPEGRSPNANGPPEAYDAVNKVWVYRGDEVARHPSQLYEAALEGLLLFVILSALAWRFKLLRKPGLLTGIFLVGYGLARSLAETFRQPDAHINFLFGGVTMGMLLSLPMWLGGAWLIWQGMRREPIGTAT